MRAEVEPQLQASGQAVHIVDVEDHGDTFQIDTSFVKEPVLRRILSTCSCSGRPITILSMHPVQHESTEGRPRGRGRGARAALPRPRRPLPPTEESRPNPYNCVYELLVRQRFRSGLLDLSSTAGKPPFNIIDYNSPEQQRSLVFCIKKECAGVCFSHLHTHNSTTTIAKSSKQAQHNTTSTQHNSAKRWT